MTGANADAYLASQIDTASPEKLHLLVVRGALRFAEQAKQAYTAQQFDQYHLALSRARACVTELLVSVKPEPNRELADNLKSLFTFVHRQFNLADLHRSPEQIDDGVKVLAIHHDTWLELMQAVGQPVGSVGGSTTATLSQGTTVATTTGSAPSVFSQGGPTQDSTAKSPARQMPRILSYSDSVSSRFDAKG